MIKNIYNLIRITAVFTLYGVFFKKKNRGKRLAKALTILGPSFIKFGQALSVRPDIVGNKTAEDLSCLQDNVPPFHIKYVKKIIRKQFGKDIPEVFAEFEEKPVAAASISQVHKAKTNDGKFVAVKILRPHIEKRFKRDIKLFYFIAKIISKLSYFKRLKPVSVVQVFENTVQKELDLRLEAAAASQLRENCKDDAGFIVPEIYWQYTSKNILVLDWVEGIPLNDVEKLKKSGHNLEKISKHLSISFLNQSFRDGFFHADIHPGNLFIDKNGNIVPVDFGIMGRMNKETRLYVAEILRGFLIGDYEHVAKIHFDAGYVPKTKSVEDFTLACRAIGEPIMGLSSDKISIANLLALLFKITEDFEMETQPQLLLFQKTLLLVEGVGQKLYPKVNMWQQTEEWVKQWAKENLGLEAKIKSNIQEIISILNHAPQNLKKLEKALDMVLAK